MTLEVVLDVVLVVLAAIRATRLIVIDSLGRWLVVGPVLKRAYNTRYEKWVESLLSCPFCIGYWISLLAVASLAVAGGPGEAAGWWRVLAGSFAVSYIVGHAVARWDYS